MTPFLDASRAVLDEMFDAMADFIRPLDETCLNWAPLDDDANSIAAMVVHVGGSIDAWLARAADEPASRDRDAEFRARAGASQLIEAIERARSEARRRLAALDGADLGRQMRVVRLGSGKEQHVSVAWCVEHAIIHGGEHWGQIQLTRQLYDARR